MTIKAFRNDIDGVLLPMDAYRVRSSHLWASALWRS